MSVAQHYAIRGLVDSRHELPTRPHLGPSVRRALSHKSGVVVHYAGANQNLNRTDMQLWRSYAQWHIDKPTWGVPGTSVKGNGIMYHLGISRTGEKHLLYDIEVDRWHCGSWPENGIALAINIPIGGGQRATPQALKALQEVVDDWITAGHGTRKMVIGHQEVDWTSCPGTLMGDFVLPYREGMMTTERGKWFPETKHYVGGGFWDYWANNGGLMVFGFPISDEFDAPDSSGKVRTMQVFERAVFEFHPENKEPHRVLLRRLGAEVKDDLLTKAV